MCRSVMVLFGMCFYQNKGHIDWPAPPRIRMYRAPSKASRIVERDVLHELVLWESRYSIKNARQPDSLGGGGGRKGNLMTAIQPRPE